METIEKKISDKTIYYQVHKGTNDLFEYMDSLGGKNEHYKNRDEDFWILNKDARNSVRGTGIETQAEGIEYLRHGYKKHMERLKEKLKMKNKKQEGYVKGARYIDDVVGEAVIVAKALMGLPTCMRRRISLVKKAKVIRLIVLTGFPGHVTSDKIEEAGMRITMAAQEVERQGNRMEIYVGDVTDCGSNKGTFCVTKIKNADQPFDMMRVGFPLCCPGMARWLMLSWTERAKGIPDAGWAYGKAAARSWGGDKVCEIAKSILGRNSVVLVQDGHWDKDPEVIAHKILQEANETGGER